MTKTRQNENETFKPLRILAIRDLGGASRATPRTRGSCDGPRGGDELLARASAVLKSQGPDIWPGGRPGAWLI